MKSLSLSEIISSGNPLILTTLSKNKYTSYTVLYSSLNGMIMEYFVCLSTTTIMLSYTSFVVGSINGNSFVMKSIVIDTHGNCGSSIFYRYPYFL